MKLKKIRIVFFFFLFLSFFAFGADLKVLDERYPGFHDYEGISLSGVREYFRILLSKSVVTGGDRNFYLLEVKNKMNETVQFINCSIRRTINNDEITESVMYNLSSSGMSFTFTLKRIGENLKLTDDLDLLSFKFHTNEKLHFYELSVPQFGIIHQRELQRSIDQLTEKSLLRLSYLGMDVYINSHATPDFVHRDYLYFIQGKMNLQKNLKVIARKIESSGWDGMNFSHYSDVEGLITPMIFFNRLNDGASFFKVSSGIYISILNGIGFPIFQPQTAQN